MSKLNSLVMITILLVAACSTPLQMAESGAYDGPWMIAVQPGGIHEAYVAKFDLMPTGLPDCAVGSDQEYPILRRDGRSIALRGCWKQAGSEDGTYETVVIHDRSIRHLPIVGAEWVGSTAYLVGISEDGWLRVVDSAKEGDSGRALVNFESPTRTIDVDFSGKNVLVVYGGKEVSYGRKVTLADTKLEEVSLSDGRRRVITAPAGTVNARWVPGKSEVVAETLDEWITLDSRTGNVVEQRPRPTTTLMTENEGNATLSCHLLAITKRSVLGWCPATGELMSYSQGRPGTRVARVPQAAPLNGTISVAPDVVDR
jgi:hypothetical protein